MPIAKRAVRSRTTASDAAFERAHGVKCAAVVRRLQAEWRKRVKAA